MRFHAESAYTCVFVTEKKISIRLQYVSAAAIRER